MRLRRTMLGLSQENIGQSIGVTFQQVQKYERGANRISCSRLYEVAQLLSVSVGFFFEEMASGGEMAEAHVEGSVLVTRERCSFDRETLEAMRAFGHLPEKIRTSLASHMRLLAAAHAP